MFRTSHISSFSSVIISKITSPLTKSGVLKSVCEIMCAHMPRWNGLGVAVTRSMKFERHHRSHQLKHISPAQPCKFTQTDTKKKQFTNRTNVLSWSGSLSRCFRNASPEVIAKPLRVRGWRRVWQLAAGKSTKHRHCYCFSLWGHIGPHSWTLVERFKNLREGDSRTWEGEDNRGQ